MLNCGPRRASLRVADADEGREAGAEQAQRQAGGVLVGVEPDDQHAEGRGEQRAGRRRRRASQSLPLCRRWRNRRWPPPASALGPRLTMPALVDQAERRASTVRALKWRRAGVRGRPCHRSILQSRRGVPWRRPISVLDGTPAPRRDNHRAPCRINAEALAQPAGLWASTDIGPRTARPARRCARRELRRGRHVGSGQPPPACAGVCAGFQHAVVDQRVAGQQREQQQALEYAGERLGRPRRDCASSPPM